MGFLSTGIFWGAVLVLMGLSVLLKAVFNIDIPIFRVLVGLFFIYFGVQIVWGTGLGHKPPCPNVTTQGKVDEGKGPDYNVIFGQGVINLTGVEIKDKNVELKANTLFGSSTVRLKKDIPALVKASSAFGNARLPGGNSTAMGTLYYKTPSYQEDKPHLTLELSVVFGESTLSVEE